MRMNHSGAHCRGLIAFIIALLWLTCARSQAIAEKIEPDYILTTGDLPPYSYVEKNVQKGIAYDLALTPR
jgi:hypothetical protein